MKDSSDVADYFVICSADNKRAVKSIADNVEKTLKEKDIAVYGKEGYEDGNWILVDIVDVVIHIFYEPLRGFYDLEGLWADMPKVELPFDEKSKFEVG